METLRIVSTNGLTVPTYEDNSDIVTVAAKTHAWTVLLVADAEFEFSIGGAELAPDGGVIWPGLTPGRFSVAAGQNIQFIAPAGATVTAAEVLVSA